MTDTEKSTTTSIDDAFSESDVTETEEKGEEVSEKVAEIESVTTDETEVEPPSTEEVAGLKAALKANRQKARDAEAKANALKEKYEPDQEAPDPIIDPEEYETYLKGKWEKERQETIANKSRDRMIEKHSDYEEKEKVFMFLSSQDKSLVDEMWESSDPGLFAYEKANAYQEEQREAIRAELQAEFEQVDHTKEEVKDEKPVSKKAPDLITASGNGNKTEEVETLNEDIGDLF